MRPIPVREVLLEAAAVLHEPVRFVPGIDGAARDAHGRPCHYAHPDAVAWTLDAACSLAARRLQLGRRAGDLYAVVSAYHRVIGALCDAETAGGRAGSPAILLLRAATYDQVIAAIDRAIIDPVPLPIDR